ncbi:hypothetical protein Taro_019206 [Colocasia esculenta]|uniref:Uncharacterized protein n=1 Tax=Colocasia esculenta TaxID=4460 RepID=A0A843UYJ9_COLES|nr:hypothetical protein [Colocasia esculenta]
MERRPKRKHYNIEHILTIGSDFLFVCRQAPCICRQLLLKSGFQNHMIRPINSNQISSESDINPL